MVEKSVVSSFQKKTQLWQFLVAVFFWVTSYVVFGVEMK